MVPKQKQFNIAQKNKQRDDATSGNKKLPNATDNPAKNKDKDKNAKKVPKTLIPTTKQKIISERNKQKAKPVDNVRWV